METNMTIAGYYRIVGFDAMSGIIIIVNFYGKILNDIT
jgi:hypothetical protein